MPHLLSPELKEQSRATVSAIPFRGFPPPTSNTTYTPNQFFDVVLPHSSRGVVRLVALLIRKTLGWCDTEGNPQETEIRVSYSDLQRRAGIDRSMVRQAIDEALAAHFIRCVREGQPNRHGVAAQSALFELCWDEGGAYTTDPAAFRGFFAGEGNRTHIPNCYFDHVIRTEPLAVIRVVGAVIRHTIGFQTKYGFRRQQVRMSYAQLHRRTRLASSRTLTHAIQTALAHNYLLRIEAGVIDFGGGLSSRPAVYALRWEDTSLSQLVGPRSLPMPEEAESGNGGKRTAAQRLEKESGAGTERLEKDSGETAGEGARRRAEKDSDTETTPRNNTGKRKQQQAAAHVREAADLLRANGFTRRDAERLAVIHPLETIRAQINGLERRHPTRNRVGMLRRAIEENWPLPEATEVETESVETGHGARFAAHFYAGFHRNEGAPIARPSGNDVQQSEPFVRRLLNLWPDEGQVSDWGRALGEIAAKAQPQSDRRVISCVAAIRSHGDALFARLSAQRARLRQETTARARDEHQRRHWAAYLDHLRAEEERLRREEREAYARFETHRLEERARTERGRFLRPDQRERLLQLFDADPSRLRALQAFFPGRVLDFWSWDARINSTRFDLTDAPL